MNTLGSSGKHSDASGVTSKLNALMAWLYQPTDDEDSRRGL